MISANQYQDIEIQQGADFENVITFETSHGMDAQKQFVGKIQKDFANSTFTGPQKSNNTVGTQANNDNWESATVTQIYFDLVASISGSTVTLTLPAEATIHFTDDFEGVWELSEKDVTTAANPIYTRHIQGDVVISKSAIQLDNTWKAAA
jgi:hypothetical protein